MSFLGGIIGGLTGFLTGGPIGAIAGVAGGLSAGGGHTTNPGGTQSAAPMGPAGLPYNPALLGFGQRSGGAQGGGVMGGLGPGGGGTVAPSPAAIHAAIAGGAAQGPNGACAKGHHLNKSHYFVKKALGTVHEVQKGSTCVKNRRMNVGNARALRHALRRARGFEKLAMRTIHILHPRRKGSFGGFKTRRRR